MLDRFDLSVVRAVALDVDGTLAGADSKVSHRTILAMKRVQELGIPVILLTGRTRRNTMHIATEASLRNVAVACNGALIIDPVTDSNVAVNPMSASDKATFWQLAEDLGLDLTWWTEDHMYVTHRGDMYDLILELNHEEALVGDPADIADAVVMKMMAMSSVERMDEVQEEILRRMPNAMRSLDNLVEVVDPESTKWHGLEWALERYGVDPATVLGAGDGGNDVVWLSRIGFPVAMGNARDEVREVTLAEGLSNADDGAADLLERVAAAHEGRWADEAGGTDVSARAMLAELARDGDYLLATYALDLPVDVDAWARVSRFAVGQTTGTWVEVPGLTPELKERHEGRVVQVLPVPGADTSNGVVGEVVHYLATLAFPTINFGASIPQLLNTLIGNDASTSMEAKLVDLAFPGALERQFGGPRFGVQGLRELTGVSDRPLLLNMLKPCTGLAPEAASDIFEATARGGIDLIKDDELMGNTEYSTVLRRVELFTAAAERAAAETGVRTIYLPNISDRPDRMLATAKRAVDAGARALMVAYTTVGLGAVEMLADEVGVPILGHFAGAAPLYEGPHTGMSAPLATGLLPRLAGADLGLVVSPYGGYPISRLQYLRTAQQLALPRPHLKPAFPVIGGGVHPGTVERYVGELGGDIVLGVGGAIQGHPDGAAAGVRAMRQAMDAALAGVPAADAGAEQLELATALKLWGTL